MRIRFSLLFLFLISGIIRAQDNSPTFETYFREGTYLLIEGQIDKARKNFEEAYRLDSTSANINFLMGATYLQSPLDKEKAEYYLDKAVGNVSANYRGDDPSEKAAAPMAHYYYGQALHVNYKFDEAIAQFGAFRQYVDPKDDDFLKMVDKEIATSKLAMTMMRYPINAHITNLGDSLNSIYPEYSAVLSADERMIIYTTRRPETMGGLMTDDGQYFEDIVVAYKDDNNKWSAPQPLSANVNTYGHEASVNLTPDGQTLIVFRNVEGKEPEGNGNIYYTTFDGKDWSPLMEFGSDVNSEYWESHACLSADGNLLFFSSERPGGFGGKDIYRCVKLPNGKWSKALNMGPLINSAYDEDGGFMHPDDKTFFFASNGPLSMGGFDIMYATLNEDNKFTDVTNMGYPVNTTDDDIFYVVSPDGRRGYFSSAKAGGYGDKDIYMITIAEGMERYLALFKGQIVPAEGEILPDNIRIVVTDKNSNEIIGTYRPKPVNGTFSTILPPGREYNFSYQADEEEFYNEDVFVSSDLAYQEINRAVALEAVRLGGKVKVKQKNILLNAVILNNSKSKKPVPGAQLMVQEAGGAIQIFSPDSAGTVQGVALDPDKMYYVYSEFNGKRSDSAEISTMGIVTARIMNQVIYLEGKPEKLISKSLQLSVRVKTVKTKKPVPDATIVLTDAGGERRELITDSAGVIKDIGLVPGMVYELLAIKDSSASEIETFTTGVIGDGRSYSETMLLDWKSPEEIAEEERRRLRDYVEPGSRFHFTYKYGRKVINENEKSWLMFIDYITLAAQNRPSVTINIRSSASRVPTSMKGGNKRLAAIRAKNFEDLIRTNLQEREVDLDKVKFSRSSIVSGPHYRGDWKVGRRKYEKFQYVRGTVK